MDRRRVRTVRCLPSAACALRLLRVAVPCHEAGAAVPAAAGRAEGLAVHAEPVFGSRVRRPLAAGLFAVFPLALHGAQIVLLAAAEEMRGRPPGMMYNPVEPSGGIEPREGIRGGQLSRRDRGEGDGPMITLQGIQFPRCIPHRKERGGDLGRDTPADDPLTGQA